MAISKRSRTEKIQENQMRYIKGLTKDTLKLLERIYQQSKYYQVRQRAHCIRLSYQGYKISAIIGNI